LMEPKQPLWLNQIIYKAPKLVSCAYISGWRACCLCLYAGILNGFRPAVHNLFLSRVSSGSLTTDWRTGRPRFDPLQRQIIFLLASVSRPFLGPT
jgi:hypothetical protein